MDPGKRWIRKQFNAGSRTEPLANEKVAITAHDKTWDTGGCQLSQGPDYPTVVRIRVIVAYPGFEQVAQYVERVCGARVSLQEAYECIGCLRT